MRWWKRRREGGANERAKALFRRGRREDALDLWRRLASDGDAAAAANLAIEYAADGDLTEAMMWYRTATMRGMRIPPSDPGIRLHSMAGRKPAAEAWWRRAFDTLGDLDSCNYLGIALHERGEDGEAERYWLMAADRGHEGAAQNLDALHQLRLETEGPGDQREEAAARALPWVVRAARSGDADATSLLAELDASIGPEEVPRVSVDEGEERWRAAVHEGDADAALALGFAYLDAGREAEAAVLWQLAADWGHAGAAYNLGVRAEHRGDPAERVRWYQQAAEAGHREAAAGLGQALLQGGDVIGAEPWLRLAAERGSVSAMCNLGTALGRIGRVREAFQWWQHAAQGGDHWAAAKLEEVRRAGYSDLLE